MNAKTFNSTFVTTARLIWLATTTRCFLTLCSALVLAGTAGAAERPFKGRIDGQFVANPTVDAAIYVGGAQAVGKGAHVGAFTKLTSDVTDIATGEVEGSFTMTAANGDHVTGLYRGFIVFGSAPGTFSWVLDATVTGGSGQFFGASGRFVFSAEGVLAVTDGIVHGNYTETFEGSIDY